jgi:hypothetical protein
MVAMSLIFVVLGLAAVLVSDYSTIFRRSAPRERLLEVMELAVERVCGEAGSAIRILSPTIGAASVLSFDRIDPAAVDRLPFPPPAAPPATWLHDAPAHIMTVDYMLSSGRLLRRTTSATATASEEIVDGLAGFSAALVTDRSLRVTISVEVNDRLQTSSKEATLWVDR